MGTVEHPLGNYRFLPGIAPYSRGVVASPGFEIIHVVFRRPRPYREGFEAVAERLDAEGRPRAALCGIELRSPCPFSFEGFATFNHEYAKILDNWGLFVDGINPIARTNVAPEIRPPAEPILHGFSYTKPVVGSSHSAPTFVVAGAGELPEGVLSPEGIIAPADLTDSGLARKASFVMSLMEERLRGLGGEWPDVTEVDVYTVHPIQRILTELILTRVESESLSGVHWHHVRPPIAGIEFEMDLRGIRQELRA